MKRYSQMNHKSEGKVIVPKSLFNAVLSLAITAVTFAAPPQTAKLFSNSAGSHVAQQRRTTLMDLSLLNRLPTDGTGKLQFNLFDDVNIIALFKHLDTASTDAN